MEADECLYGGDDTDGAVALLSQAEKALGRLSRFTDNFDGITSQIVDLRYRLDDVAQQLRDARDELSYSADELETIEERLHLIHKLRRKYGADCEEILQYLDNAAKELEEIELNDDILLQLRKELSKAEKTAWDRATALRNSRKLAAQALSERILTELAQLDMPRVQFECRFAETELTPTGADTVAFYMSANAGEALKPMSRVASGGELARIMLAMKNVLAEKDQVHTLIFDEVDTGVSGRAAQKVAEKLRAVARHKQVLCVTHLPQMAALAHNHLLIAKTERDGRTYTTVTPLDLEGRKRELARIIGGANITETTLKSAEEMLALD
jgi:DNA repair protein RecN (Recombination protein N)